MWKFLNVKFPVEIQILVNCRSFSIILFLVIFPQQSILFLTPLPLSQSPVQQVIFPAPVSFPAIPAPEIITSQTTAALTVSPARSMEPPLLWRQQLYSDAQVSAKQTASIRVAHVRTSLPKL